MYIHPSIIEILLFIVWTTLMNYIDIVLNLQVTVISTEEGSYELMKKVGKGGFGKVYKAREEASHRIVAIKFLKKKCKIVGTLREVSVHWIFITWFEI